jgi:signal transduction histidine kinase/FixJ family two-component response regulator
MRAYRIAYLGNDGEVAMGLESALKDDGLQFMSAPGDYHGMEKAVNFKADVVLWDRDNLPADAAFPLEQIRKSGLANQPIVAVVRNDDLEGAVKSLAGGASDFIYKPLKEDPLPRVIAALNMGQKQRRVDWCNRVIDDTNDQVKGILATLTDPAYIVSPEYQILWMNRAAEEIFGEGQRGGACHHIFYDRTEPCEVCAKNKGAARWRATLKNGKSYRFISAVIRNSKGEVEKLAVGTDITPDQEVSKIHKTFIANVSHDLRTPLAAIDQYVNILLDGLAGELNEDQANYVDVIRRSSFRLHNLIENLIDANKILSGDYKLKMEVVSIQDILDVVLGRLESQAADKGIMMQVQVADGLPAVYADKSRIAQVVANLAGNSLKFTEQGMMQIRAGFMPRDEGRVIVSVEDTGIGVPKEDLGKIFDLFYRVEKDKVYVEEGAGLGLSISREIIRAHGGTLWAESMEGMGSAFHFSIPAYKGQAPLR